MDGRMDGMTDGGSMYSCNIDLKEQLLVLKL